ncbi:hypothetical protein ACN27F_08875 [Solwaraspora sp. WMMB335]|uniref:hypothetical protein n=1 Tax=Solwaraspora sp. WMMB335 TaxID=3404118 RepID=UPI003B92CB34
MSSWRRVLGTGALGIVLAGGWSSLDPPAGRAQPVVHGSEQELVAVAINDVGQSAPTYQIEAVNRTAAPVDVTLRLGVPSDASVATVGSGGQVAQTEITWQLSLPGNGAATVNASFRPGGSTAAQTFPVCAYERDTARPYDCAAARWTPSAGLEPTDRSWWQRPSMPLLAGLSALVVVTMIGYGWRRRLQERRVDRRRIVTAAGRRIRTPATPPPSTPRWRPGTPVVLGLLCAMLAGLAVASVQAATYGSQLLDRANQAPSGWIGDAPSGGFGVLLTESAFEFTVYRLACVPAGEQVRRCLATVAVRNRSDAEQFWYAPLQRAHLPTGDWVGVDEKATREENGGRDIFADPLPAGARLLVPLAFSLRGELVPQRLELRSGAFSAGVTVRSI